jgi:Flp pilus assembly protein TadD
MLRRGCLVLHPLLKRDVGKQSSLIPKSPAHRQIAPVASRQRESYKTIRGDQFFSKLLGERIEKAGSDATLPEIAKAWKVLAQHLEAIDEYRKAIELDARNAMFHIILGAALNDQHKTEEAIAEYRKAIDLDPRDASRHQNLAIILRTQGKTKEADAEDQKAKELGANHPD